MGNDDIKVVNKVQISGTTYDISPSPTASLIGYNSYDAENPTSWEEVNVIYSNDDNAAIFAKLTYMVKNIRFLYSKILDKAEAEHTHSTSDINSGVFSIDRIPASTTHKSAEESGDQYVPTSSLVYTMNQSLAEINSETMMGSDFTTNIRVGALASGTSIKTSDRARDVLTNMMLAPEPSSEYEDVLVDEWNTNADVDAFFEEHTYENGWKDLKLGNYVKFDITLGSTPTMTTEWAIAGFNCELLPEHLYRRGHSGGIVLIPRTGFKVQSYWNSDSTVKTPFCKSTIQTAVNNINEYIGREGQILENHIPPRYVVYGTKQNGTGTPTGSTTSVEGMTSAYYPEIKWISLISMAQLGLGKSTEYNNKYDNGEADYKLPIFNHITVANYLSRLGVSEIWTRNVYGIDPTSTTFNAYSVNVTGLVSNTDVGNQFYIFPVMYLSTK